MKINMKESLLYRTGQLWKFWVQAFGGVIFVSLTVLTLSNGDGISSNLESTLLWVGTIVGISCIVFSCISIKCPICGARWFWLAVSKKHQAGGIDSFLSFSKCPVCGYSGENEV